MDVDARRVLADVARLGPFFAVATGPAAAAGSGWRPVRELYDAGSPPLRDRIAQVGRVLGGGGDVSGGGRAGERVAASIAFQGLAALLVSAPFAAVVLHGVRPELTARSLHWRVGAGVELWCPEPAGERVPAAAPEVAAALAAALVDGHLAPLVAATRAVVGVPERLLWGNAASAVAGAKRLVGTQRPAAAGWAAVVAAELLDHGPLAGAGGLLAPTPPDHTWTFRRRSCCLYYRVPGGGLCADCVLLPPTPPRATFGTSEPYC